MWLERKFKQTFHAFACLVKFISADDNLRYVPQSHIKITTKGDSMQ